MVEADKRPDEQAEAVGLFFGLGCTLDVVMAIDRDGTGDGALRANPGTEFSRDQSVVGPPS